MLLCEVNFPRFSQGPLASSHLIVKMGTDKNRRHTYTKSLRTCIIEVIVYSHLRYGHIRIVKYLWNSKRSNILHKMY